jgi:hypothetical protein
MWTAASNFSTREFDGFTDIEEKAVLCGCPSEKAAYRIGETTCRFNDETQAPVSRSGNVLEKEAKITDWESGPLSADSGDWKANLHRGGDGPCRDVCFGSLV